MTPKMVLVGGTGRCGTSILKEILAAHPDAASLPFEYRFIIDPDGIVDFYASYTAVWSPYIADRKLKRLERLLKRLSHESLPHKLFGQLLRLFNPDGKLLSPRIYHGWELNRHLPNFEKHVNELMANLVEFSFPACWVGTESYQVKPYVYHVASKSRQEMASLLGDFIRHVIGEYLKQKGKTFFVEDNTWNILFAQEILELLPEAKIVHIYRDPRDVVASFSQQRWSPTDKQQGARWYKSMMERWFEIRPTLPPKSYYELSLEELVASPESTLPSLCQFAEIDFDQAMLKIDLSHSHRGRWQREYSKREKLQVQSILADIIKELGYELDIS